MNRRNFIKKTTLASGGLWLAPNLNKPDFQIPAGFSPKILATNWGFSGSWEAFAAKAKEAGYDGVEVWVPGDDKGRASFMEAMQKQGLAFGLLCGGSDASFEKHLPQFETQLRNALAMKPLYVNCHSGRDYFSFEQAKVFFAIFWKKHPICDSRSTSRIGATCMNRCSATKLRRWIWRSPAPTISTPASATPKARK
jgi:hypothetical protein